MYPSFLLMRVLLTLLFFQCLCQANGSLCHEKGTRYDVIVVGAGICGLSAATLLKESGMDVLVVEADNRIGGRIWTVNPWGSALELGASWVHGIENNPVFNIVRDLHEPIQPTMYNAKCLPCKLKSMTLYDDKGKKLSKEQKSELEQLSLKLNDYLDKLALQKNLGAFSVLDAFEQFCKENHIVNEKKELLYQMSKVLYSNEYAADLKELSIQEHEVYGEEVLGTNAIIPNGYNLVTSKLARSLSIELNCQVSAILYDKNGVKCQTNKGALEAKYIVVTVPLGVLKAQAIKFSPPLPEEKTKAINTLKMGVFNKVYLFFPCSFWDKTEWIVQIPAKENSDTQFDILNFQCCSKQPILIGFVSGDYAKKIESWSDEKIIGSYMENLRKIYGANIPSPSAYVITRWGQNPLSYGSYSYLPPVKQGVNPYKEMKDPINNQVFFAGEAFSQYEPSTVFGAYMRGEEVAKEIISLEKQLISTIKK